MKSTLTKNSCCGGFSLLTLIHTKTNLLHTKQVTLIINVTIVWPYFYCGINVIRFSMGGWVDI